MTSLFEVVLYLGMSTIILTGTLTLHTQIYTFVHTQSRPYGQLIQTACALECLGKDCKRALGVKRATPHCLILRGKNRDIGWLIKKDRQQGTRLVRYVGIYTNEQWSRLSTSTLMYGVTGSLTYDYQGPLITGIRCSLNGIDACYSVGDLR